MTTLLLRLVGPMQSWGVQSRFEIRDTLQEPTKSGVIGLVCAALGWERELLSFTLSGERQIELSHLAAIRMGVRVDREGQMRYDYHIAQDIVKASSPKEKKNPDLKASQPSTRYYLADASFLVGLESEDDQLLNQLHAALANPYWPLSLGRKAFVPGEPVLINDGVQSGSLDEILRTYEWKPRYGQREPEQLRLILEDPDRRYADAPVRMTRPDQPLSFHPRRFALREVVVDHCKPAIKEEASNEPQ